MKKLPFITFLICAFIACLSTTTVAQVTSRWPPFGNVFRFGCVVTEDMRAFQITSQSVSVIDSDIDQLFKPWVLKDKTVSAILLGVKLDSSLVDYELSPVRSFSKAYTAYRISNNTDATVIAMGINKNNVDDYRYHVVVNDSAEVVHWSKIPRLEKKYGASKPYGFIGNFRYEGKQVLIEVVDIKNYQIRDGVLLDWRQSIKPVTTNLIIHGHTHYETDGSKGDSAASATFNKKVPYDTKHDNVTNEITEISFFQDDVSSIQLILKDHPTIEYNVSIVNTDDNEYGFWGGTDENGFQANFILRSLPKFPGTYKIMIRPKIGGNVDLTNQTLTIPVIIKPRPVLEKKASLKQLLPYMVAAVLVIALLFFAYRRSANLRLTKSIQAKQTTSLKLRSIRAQLNPHFMFNALTSIQNLVNKKDMEGANHYLSRFADLTRKVLFTSERDLISLEDEVKILDDYLQMEQLRFGFKYDISVADDINVANIEVPAMLLQPFVENAVKHGVANLREKGGITVMISQKQTDLVFTITDNGLGFSSQASGQSGDSFGLKLSGERIALLNEVYKDQPTRLDIRSNDGGTTVMVTLTNWIS